MSIQCVIFDCDGVLVDSETLAMQVINDRIAALLPGVDLEPLLFDAPGHQTVSIVANIEQRSGLRLPDGIVEQLDWAVEEALDRDLEPIPGVFEALDRIPQVKAVVSNSRLERVRRSLAATGLDRVLNGTPLFSAEQVKRPKPAPDLYAFAARTLGLDVGQCLVIEDSEAGVTAARAAGLAVIGFVGAGHVGPDHAARLTAAGASAIVTHMDDLPSVVASWTDAA
jgi:HAD superfamily hydrolase (TIGR01509 family)